MKIEFAHILFHSLNGVKSAQKRQVCPCRSSPPFLISLWFHPCFDMKHLDSILIDFFLSENTAGEAPTVRFFLLNKKEEKGTSLYNYTTDTKTERATGLRMTEEEETKLGSLYKERKPVV